MGGRAQATIAAVKLTFLRALGVLLLLSACVPSVLVEEDKPRLDEFTLKPLERSARWVIAVPSFTVGSGSVRIGSIDLSNERGEFYKELGSGVADIFIAEAYESQQFRITERAEIDKVLFEQDLAQSGRVNPATAAAIGRIEGADLLVLGSVSEFGVQTTGG